MKNEWNLAILNLKEKELWSSFADTFECNQNYGSNISCSSFKINTWSNYNPLTNLQNNNFSGNVSYLDLFKTASSNNSFTINYYHSNNIPNYKIILQQIFQIIKNYIQTIIPNSQNYVPTNIPNSLYSQFSKLIDFKDRSLNK